MPWTINDVDRHNKGLSRKEKRKWVSVANSALKMCMSKGGDDASCAPKAIRIANGVVKRNKTQEAYLRSIGEFQETPEGQTNQTEDTNLEEGYEGYVPSSVVGFDQLEALEQSQEMYHELYSLTECYSQMVSNIIYWFEGDKAAQLRALSSEFADKIDEIISMTAKESAENAESEPVSEKFSESVGSEIIQFEEADKQGQNQGVVAYLNVAIIKPGWGNKVDNHYYPAEMLKEYSGLFKHARMYETDHRPEEKSTRTWVSTIVETGNFTDDGAPIAKVAIHDPNFAQRVRNLASAGLLNLLECSILADGKVESNFALDGRKGKKVTEITEVSAVDWVTRAGAGGHALELTETDKGGDPVDKTTSAVDKTTAQSEEETVENKTSTENLETTSQESTQETETSESSENETQDESQESSTESETTETETPVNLSEEEVRSLLKESNLHPASIEKLTSVYASRADLESAIAKEKEYLAKIIEPGRVVGMGNTESSVQPKVKAEALAEAKDRVNQKYFGGLK